MVLRQARMEDGYFTPLVCAVEARAAWHRGDIAAARQLLVGAQRLRSLLTYAVPHLAVQARIELAGVHLALGDIAGARTLMREIDELLKRRPGLGALDDEAQALRVRLSADRRPGSPGASSLTRPSCACCRCLLPICRSPRSPPTCSCRQTPSNRRRCRSTASSGSPHAAGR